MSTGRKIKVNAAEVAAKKAHEREIRGRTRRLLARLSVRPNERQSLIEYVELAYDRGDVVSALEHVGRIIRLDNENGEGGAAAWLYIRQGKSAFRAWEETRELDYLKQARISYTHAIQDHHISRDRESYYELASIHYCLGEYQQALNTFAAAMVVFQNKQEQEERDWLYVAQYSIAHIMFLSGKSEEAHELYRELMLSPMRMDVGTRNDSIVRLPLRFTNIGITLEIALILKRTGNTGLALNLLKETWDRMDKFHKNFEDFSNEVQSGRAKKVLAVREETMAYRGWNAAKAPSEGEVKQQEYTMHGKPLTERDIADGLKDFIDFRFGAQTFTAWISDWSIMNKIGDYFREERNVVFAAEWYGFSAELMGDYSYLDLDHRRVLTDIVLKRGECLASLGCYEDAEHCAHFAFHKRPSDVSVVSRSIKCCRKELKKNEEIRLQMFKVTYLMSLIKSCVQKRTKARREKTERRHYKAATSIASFVRMVLVRNRTAGDLAGHMGIIQSTRRARRLIMNKQVLQSGFLALQQWFQIWNPSATALQHAVMSWYYSRKFGAFRRGLKQLKGVGLGMLVRGRLRQQVRTLQSELDLNPDTATREMIQNDMEELFVRGSTTGNFADVAFHVDVRGRVLRLTSGARCLSAVNADDNYTGQESIAHFVGYSDSYVGQSHIGSTVMHGSTGFGSGGESNTSVVDVNRGGGILSEASYHSPLKFKQRVFRRTSGQVGGGDAGTTWFVDAPPHELGVSVAPVHNSLMSTVSDASRPLELKDYHFQDWGNQDEELFYGNGGRNPLLPAKDPPAPLAPSIAVEPIVPTFAHSSSSSSSFPAFVPRTVVELEEYLHLAPDEDVLSIVSRRSVSHDPTVHWVPFGILPDQAIARVLCCSLLSITSPSFGPMDAQRICHVVTASQNRLWANIRALSVYGTRLGDAGVLTLLKLPAPSLRALSFTSTRCTHHVANFIGKSLVGHESPFEVPLKLLHQLDNSGHGRNVSYQNLVKVTFEDEPVLGDRGAIELLRLLQYNGTIKHVVLRRCALGTRTAAQMSQFIGLSESIRTVNLNGNMLDAAAVLKLMRTIGSMGKRGPLRHLHAAAQDPSLSLEAFKDLKLQGVKLGLEMDVPAITAAMETADYLKQQLLAEEEAFSHIQKSFDKLASTESAFRRGFKRLAAASFIKQVHL